MTATEPADRPSAHEVADAALRLPVVAPIVSAAVPAADSPTETLPRRLRRTTAPRRRMSRPLILVGRAAALIVLVHLGLWASWSSGVPLPGNDVPALTASTPTPEPLPDIVPASDLDRKSTRL